VIFLEKMERIYKLFLRERLRFEMRGHFSRFETKWQRIVAAVKTASTITPSRRAPTEPAAVGFAPVLPRWFDGVYPE